MHKECCRIARVPLIGDFQAAAIKLTLFYRIHYSDTRSGRVQGLRHCHQCLKSIYLSAYIGVAGQLFIKYRVLEILTSAPLTAIQDNSFVHLEESTAKLVRSSLCLSFVSPLKILRVLRGIIA
ncbi:hypothetical protein HZ326_8985 [Fusarium oxysporum f. sp. albedinis]|nr:hypothetical protein HZ326_8985 [Fusarium oxysporum f. sp. albedinis]